MKNKKLVRDLILIAVLLCLSLVFLFVQKNSGKAGDWAIVAVNGTEIQRFPLDKEGIFPVNDGTNILCIKNMSVCLTDADCPDKLCVKQGWIKYTGQCITCLPNRLTVTVSGGDDSVELVL